MKCKHKTLIFLAGFVWLAVGIFLLTLGIQFLLATLHQPSTLITPGKFSLLSTLLPYVRDPTQTVIVLITVGLILGYFKGKMALAKSVRRQIQRIAGLPNPASIQHLYSKGYYFLIAGMVLLGISLRFLPITLDTRGTVDVAIGSALINGAMLYFRSLTPNAVKR